MKRGGRLGFCLRLQLTSPLRRPLPQIQIPWLMEEEGGADPRVEGGGETCGAIGPLTSSRSTRERNLQPQQPFFGFGYQGPPPPWAFPGQFPGPYPPQWGGKQQQCFAPQQLMQGQSNGHGLLKVRFTVVASSRSDPKSRMCRGRARIETREI